MVEKALDETKTASDDASLVSDDAAHQSTRRGVVAAAAAFAAFAGLRPTDAKATANVTVNTASTTNYGILASTGTAGSPILPDIGSTTHSIIGSQSSLSVAPLSSGVFGVRNGSGLAGVLGVNGSSGIGVAGYSLSGIAVYGETTSTTAMSAKSTSGVAIFGISTSSFGVQGISDTQAGVRAQSRTSFGIRAESQDQSGVYASTNKAGVPAIVGKSQAATNKQAARFFGNVRVDGDFAVTGAKAAAVEMPDGSLATVYCQESPEPFFEDFGRGRLTDGAARIAIDPAFASIVKLDGLMVFLTPEGENEGLYIHAKGPEGFEVRESRGGRSTLDFSWRLVAKRRDITGARLAPLETIEETVVADDDGTAQQTLLAMALTRVSGRHEA